MEKILAGHYRIVRHLGGGGFGQTFLARDSHLPGTPLCVVKQLKPKVNDPVTLQTAKRLFNREAEALYNLGNHDQIPRLLAHFEQDDEFYLVQEFIDGNPLDQEICLRRKLSEATVLDLLQDILQVLAFVHQRNVIHRDIKPANLIRRKNDQRIVLIDFGAVKEVSSQAAHMHGQSNLTVAIGSPGYMPSEQQAFHPHFSSDIYAVGMLCLQALTGLYPRELPRDAKTGEFSCDQFGDRLQLHPGFAALLDKMVRYDYRQRHENAMEALAALQVFLAQRDGTVPAGHTTVPYNVDHLVSPAKSVVTAPQATPQTAPPSIAASGYSAFQSDKTIPATGMMPTQATSELQNLSEGQQKSLERLLGESIGPIASVVLKRALGSAPTLADLIEQLVTSIPTAHQAKFRERAKLIFSQTAFQGNTTRSQNQTQLVNSGTPTSGSTSGQPTSDLVDPAFAKQCEQELAKLIGPIASLLVQRTLTQTPNLSRRQLVTRLASQIPNSEQQATFWRQLGLTP